MKKTILLSLPLNLQENEKIQKDILRRICANERTVIFTPNTKMLAAAAESKKISALLSFPDISYPDGSGIALILRAFGIRRARSAGIDLAEFILSILPRLNGGAQSLYLLGGEADTAAKAAKNLKDRYPALRICGSHHGYFKKSGEENEKLIKEINAARPDVLFVCFGFPLQEAWVRKNIDRLPTIKLCVCLGGSLDVWSGNKKRAPKPLQNAGLEWLWRALDEPKRFSILLDGAIVLRSLFFFS